MQAADSAPSTNGQRPFFNMLHSAWRSVGCRGVCGEGAQLYHMLSHLHCVTAKGAYDNVIEELCVPTLLLCSIQPCMVDVVVKLSQNLFSY